ncbi:MAG: hypothetical protein JSV02_04625 [Dehalococcoidia bacterium]|nr:MAG: hypothetical protein JSV02_04625 [Dehalococcoidia bacterium]
MNQMSTISEQSPRPTAAACSRDTCEGCAIQGKMLCIHTGKDLVDFAVLFITWAVPFFAGMIIGKFWIGLAVWFGLALLFFVYVEALILCRHCPHYAEEGFILRCHANSGFPKIPKFNPRPMGRIEQVIWLLYVAVLFLYYVPFFISSEQWLLLGLTTWALVAVSWTLQRTQCTRCCHLSCPVNRVPDDIRKGFFENYPEFDRAWKQHKQNNS